MKPIQVALVALTLTASVEGFATVPAAYTTSDKDPQPPDTKIPKPPSEGGPVDCDIAEPQAPRDVSAAYTTGMKVARMIPLDQSFVDNMVQVNTHFHFGAEHRSAGEYDFLNVSGIHDAAEQKHKPGFFCSNATIPEVLKTPYNFQHCSDTDVGSTYEFHWVYSTAGTKLGAGLVGAFDRQYNPSVIVQGQVFVIVNDPSGAHDYPDFIHGKSFQTLGEPADKVSYIGSTTGQSYNNQNTCSPILIHWHMDRKCRQISAQTLDAMCKTMIEDYDMKADTESHGSRGLVSDRLASKQIYQLV